MKVVRSSFAKCALFGITVATVIATSGWLASLTPGAALVQTILALMMMPGIGLAVPLSLIRGGSLHDTSGTEVFIGTALAYSLGAALFRRLTR